MSVARRTPSRIGIITLDEAEKLHQQLFQETRFPSASTCKACHPGHYREWSVWAHAYSQMSPVFNAMQGKVLLLTNGTNGDFCIRCHTPVGMNLEEPEFISNMDRHPTSREGITCVACPSQFLQNLFLPLFPSPSELRKGAGSC